MHSILKIKKKLTGYFKNPNCLKRIKNYIPRSKVEAEHRSTLLLLLVQLVRADLPLPDWQRLRFISGQVFRYRLYIKENWFLSDTIVILSMNDEFSSVINLQYKRMFLFSI